MKAKCNFKHNGTFHAAGSEYKGSDERELAKKGLISKSGEPDLPKGSEASSTARKMLREAKIKQDAKKEAKKDDKKA